MVGERTEIVVSMDWTEFDADDHSTWLSACKPTMAAVLRCCGKPIENRCSKGNAMPMRKSCSPNSKQTPPEGIFVTVVADRGFGYMEPFERLEQELGFAYIIRFKGKYFGWLPVGEQVPARDRLTPTGRTRTLKSEVELTGQRQPVERVYCCQPRVA